MYLLQLKTSHKHMKKKPKVQSRTAAEPIPPQQVSSDVSFPSSSPAHQTYPNYDSTQHMEPYIWNLLAPYVNDKNNHKSSLKLHTKSRLDERRIRREKRQKQSKNQVPKLLPPNTSKQQRSSLQIRDKSNANLEQAPKKSQYKVQMNDFELLKVLGTGAYGKVFLVRKLNGHDKGKLYAMKVLRKEIVAQKTKTLDHTRTERKVLESIRNEPFLVTMHYAFQTKTKLHLILDYVNGGELFTHLYQRDHFKEDDVKIYIGELILALEKLHKVSIVLNRILY